MSTPYPTEEDSQTNNAEPVWNPWKSPAAPHWYSGMGFTEDTAYTGPAYRALETAGSATAKGESVLGGLLTAAGRVYSSVGTPRVVGKEMEPIGADIQADARERVKAMTPDSATTGIALNVLHGVGEGAYLLTVGSALGGPAGGAALVGSVEGGSRYQELREQGVDRGTAAASGAVTGVTSAAGAFLPAAYGSTLLARLATGAAANEGFGIVNRFADHQILEAGGYPEMAEQQKVFDGTQMLIDAALGATFGGIHHFTATRDVEKQDAALTANLALRDRQSAPGVATDPEAANTHQAALEKAQADLLQRKSVDVSDSGVDRSAFLSRPERDLTPENEIILKSFKESGLLDEEANLKDLEDQFSQRIGQTTPKRESTKPATEEPEQPITGFTTAKGSTYEITPTGTTIRNKSVHPEHPGDEGMKPESHRTYYVTPEDADVLGEIQTQGGPKRALAEDGNGNLGLRYKEGPSAGKIERRTVVKDRGKPAVGLTPVETWNNGRDVHFGNKITDLRRESVKPAAQPGSDAYSVQEEALTDEYRQAFQGLRSDVQAHEDDGAAGAGVSEGPVLSGPGGRAESGEPLTVHRGAALPLAPEHFEPEALGHATGRPTSGLGVYFTSDKEEAGRYGPVVSSHRLDIRNPLVVHPEDLPTFDSLEEATKWREQMRAKGHDGIVIDATHVGGPTHYVAFDPHQALPDVDPKLSATGDPVTQALAEKPDLQIADENGKPINAAMALEGAKPETDWFTATKAAVDCFARRGG